MAFTTHGGNLALAFLLTAGTATRPTAWHVALHTGDPGVAGTANELVVGTDPDYVRKSVTFATPASRQALSDAAVSWTAGTTAGYNITHVSIWDAATAGNCLLAAAKPVVVAVTTGKVTTFAIGEIIANAL